MMIALEPVRQKWGLDRIIVSTYQAVSGAGMGAILETQRELREVLNDGVMPNDLQAEILPAGADKNTILLPLMLFLKLMSSRTMITLTKR